MEETIKNKVAIVTGGASGIGLSIVDSFVKSGAKFVIIIDINEELGNKAVKGITEQYGDDKAIFFKCDVTSDLEKIFNDITSTYKDIVVLVNNAGIADEKSLKKTININVISLMEWSVKFYDYMRKDRNGIGGTIINIASIYGLRVGPFLSIYHASKFAVVGFSKSLGHVYNYKRSGVRVVTVCPGFTNTDLIQKLRTREDEVADDFDQEAKSNDWQDVDSVGSGVIEVFGKAESGTVWVIEGTRSPEIV